MGGSNVKKKTCPMFFKLKFKFIIKKQNKEKRQKKNTQNLGKFFFRIELFIWANANSFWKWQIFRKLITSRPAHKIFVSKTFLEKPWILNL